MISLWESLGVLVNFLANLVSGLMVGFPFSFENKGLVCLGLNVKLVCQSLVFLLV